MVGQAYRLANLPFFQFSSGFHASYVSAHLDEEEPESVEVQLMFEKRWFHHAPSRGSKLCLATSRKVKRTDDRESCLHARAVLACVPVCGSAR